MVKELFLVADEKQNLSWAPSFVGNHHQQEFADAYTQSSAAHP